MSASNHLLVQKDESNTKDRRELIEEYLREFVSPAFQKIYPQIYLALKNALGKLPENVYLTVTDRARPILFVNSITSGIGRYANATEFTVGEDDLPMFADGFYLVILSDELNEADDVQAVEGVLLHEIAHRYLEHLKSPDQSCALEREANRLVKEWGFEQEYQKAKETFGSKKIGDSPCHDIPPPPAQ